MSKINRPTEAIESLKKALKSIHPLPWEFSANVPFNVDLKKPRASLSKHDDERPTYWHYEDGLYAAIAVNAMPELLSYIEELEAKLNRDHSEVNYW